MRAVMCDTCNLELSEGGQDAEIVNVQGSCAMRLGERYGTRARLVSGFASLRVVLGRGPALACETNVPVGGVSFWCVA